MPQSIYCFYATVWLPDNNSVRCKGPTTDTQTVNAQKYVYKMIPAHVTGASKPTGSTKTFKVREGHFGEQHCTLGGSFTMTLTLSIH